VTVTVKQQPRSWVVCERGERWYRAVCRFASSDRKENSHFHVDRAPFESPGYVTTVTRARRGNVIVIWEIHADLESDATKLDTIAMIRADWPRATQLGWLPASCSGLERLAVQEAGIQVLLSDLASLQNFVPALKRDAKAFG